MKVQEKGNFLSSYTPDLYFFLFLLILALNKIAIVSLL